MDLWMLQAQAWRTWDKPELEEERNLGRARWVVAERSGLGFGVEEGAAAAAAAAAAVESRIWAARAHPSYRCVVVGVEGQTAIVLLVYLPSGCLRREDLPIDAEEVGAPCPSCPKAGFDDDPQVATSLCSHGEALRAVNEPGGQTVEAEMMQVVVGFRRRQWDILFEEVPDLG